MCVVSMIYDYMKDKVPPDQFTEEAYKQFEIVKKEVAKLDELLNQKDCVDPEKAKYDEEVRAALIKQFEKVVNSPNYPENIIKDDGYCRKLEEES